MSNGWAVRGLADPYFTFYQANTAGMDAASLPPGAGATAINFVVDVALLALPAMAADPDEVHPLVSYVEWGPPRRMLAGVGITPNGRLVAITAGGGRVQTGSGLLVPDGIKRRVTTNYFTGSTQAAIYINDVRVAGPAAATGGAGVPAVGAGQIGRFMLFNGDTLAARAAFRLFRVEYDDDGGEIVWALDEGAAASLKGTSPEYLTQDFTLEAAILNGLAANSPWGTPANTDPRASFAWQIATDYTRIPAPTTSYFGRVQV